MEREVERRSPVLLPGKIVDTTVRDHWTVVLSYADEGLGPWLVDLSHGRRWDFQGLSLAEAIPTGWPKLPDAPGGVVLSTGGLVGRIGPRQALLWTFGDESTIQPKVSVATEVTEGTLCIALLGRDIFRIAEKLTRLDLTAPCRRTPFLLLGPFAHITCQIVVSSHDPERGAFLVSCARGFGHDMVHALLSAGKEYGMRPAGEKRFMDFFQLH